MEENWGLIGHQNIVKFLKNSVKQNRLANTYLFYGVRRLGKTTLAKKFAAEIIGSQAKNSAEFFELMAEEGKKNIAIEQVREFRRSMSLKAFTNGYKVGLIYDAHKLNRESANALLKTIEEPVAKTVIIIVTSDWSKLLGTIISRSQRIKFLPVASADIKAGLEPFKLKQDKIDKVIKIANGRPGLALKLVEDEAYFLEFNDYQNSAQQILSGKISSRWQLLDELIDSQKDLAGKVKEARLILNHLELLLREILFKNLGLFSSLNNINYSNIKIVNLLNLIGKSKEDLQSNVQPRLVLENLFINL